MDQEIAIDCCIVKDGRWLTCEEVQTQCLCIFPCTVNAISLRSVNVFNVNHSLTSILFTAVNWVSIAKHTQRSVCRKITFRFTVSCCRVMTMKSLCHLVKKEILTICKVSFGGAKNNGQIVFGNQLPQPTP